MREKSIAKDNVKKNSPVMKEEADVQIFHVHHILRKCDRKITSRHVQKFGILV